MYTSVLEFDVMKLMTTMVRYPLFEDDSIKEEAKNPDKLESWGHLTCDGTVANIEAFWAARNSKFLAYAIQQALLQSPKLKRAQEIKVVTATGEELPLVKLDLWTILNIPVDRVLSLPHRIWTLVNASTGKSKNKEEEKADPTEKKQSEAKVTLDDVYAEIGNYTIARKGLMAYFLPFFQQGIKPPKYFVPGSKHYSLPKAGSMLGIGEEDVVDIAIDADARLLVDDLVKKLEDCLKNKIPVLAVVCVMGSTEESATDPLVTVLEVREKFRKQGLDFHIHADAAYGGYFSCLMGEDEQDGLPVPRSYSGQPKFDPISAFPDLNDHTRKQFQSIRKADSITVDPHKVGFVPYAVGSILYKNSLIKKTLNFSAPVLNPNVGPSMSTFGLEGSKAGATAAAVYLTHTCLPLDKDGHGRLLGYCLYNTKVYYAKLLSLPRMNNGVEEKYRITSVCRTPVEKGWKPISPDYRGTKEQIVDLLARRSNEEISRDLDEKPAFRGMVNESGPDQNIISYSINFKDASGNWNTSLQRMNRFNDILYQKYLSPQAQAVPDVNEWEIKDIRDYKLMLSHTEFARANYGQVYYDSFVKRSEVNDDITDVTQKKIVAMRSVLLSPWAAEASFFDTILDELVRACDATMKELSAEEKKRKFLAKKA
jgi:glutamate/tyrosine decarboxylase-like PLP-dependent enzyme